MLRHLILDRNRALILAFEFGWGLAMPFVYYSTVLPGYLRHLHVSNAWIGLAPAIHSGTIALVQPLSAYAFRRGEGRVGRLRVTYALGALAYVLLGALVLTGYRPFWLALATVGTFALAIGVGDPHYLQLVVDSVQPSLRGRFFGMRNVSLGAGGILGGSLAGLLLRSGTAPNNFGHSFLAGGLLFTTSTLVMAFYRDRQEPEAPARPESFQAFLTENVAGLVRRPGFGAYLASAFLFSLAVCAFPFLGLLVKDRLQETDRIFGLLGALLMGCNLLLAPALGLVCDRWGSRRGFVLALACYTLGVVGCLVFRDPLPLLFSYALACSWMPGQFVAATDLALRLTAGAPASEVTAIMMAAMAPARIVGPVLLGAGLDRWGYAAVLPFCAGIALLAIGLVVAGGSRWTRSGGTRSSAAGSRRR